MPRIDRAFQLAGHHQVGESAAAHVALPGPDVPAVAKIGPVLNPEFHQRVTAETRHIGWYERRGGMHARMFLPGRRAGAALRQNGQVLSR
jgi:hypothetical protein